MRNQILIILLIFSSVEIFSISKVDSLLSITNNDTSNIESKIRAYNLLAGNYNRTVLDSSLYYANLSFQLAKKHNNNIGMCKAYFNTAIAYRNYNNSEEAIKYYLLAYNYAIKENDLILTSNLLLNTGIEYTTQGLNNKAIVVFNKSIQLAKQANNIEQEIKVLNSLGNTYVNMIDYSKAQITFLTAIELNKTLKNDYYDAILFNDVANVYFYLSNYDKAIEYYYLSLKIGEKINDEYLINSAYGNIGLIYSSIGQYRKAIDNLKTSIDYHKSNNDKEKTADAYNSVGIAYRKLIELDTALLYFNKSLNIKQEIKDTSGTAMIYNNIGEVYLDKNNKKLAEKNLLLAVKISSKYSNFYVLSLSYLVLGELYPNTDKGLKYYLLANKIAIKYNINDVSITSYEYLYLYHKNNRNYKKSLYYFEKYTQLNDSLVGAESKLRIEETETKYEVDKKDNEILFLYKEQEAQKIIAQKEQERNKFEKLLIGTIAGLIILIISIFLIRFRQKQKNKINKLEKRGLKVETQMLRSQMNPHFIFNSLNSIQSFISDKDTIDAERYLSKFAKLMRLILDNSRKPFITVENEINTLKLYLELEKLRFDNRFNYKININNIDDEFTIIPPMLAQPYIENAILHGVGSITNGEINIDFNQTENKIICTIDDNGIGRTKSAEIKQQSSSKKTSLGIQVTQERIELLKEENNIELAINIIDKFNEQGIATGTKVVVEMPFKE